MATFFGKLLGGLGIGKNAKPSFASSSPVGMLAPAKTLGVIQQPSQIGILNPNNDTLGVLPQKSSTFEKIVDSATSVVGIAKSASEILSKNSEPTYNGGTIPEVTVTATKPNFVDNIKNAVAKVSEGKPVVSMGQEFSISDNLKVPIYLGLALLAYKVIKGGK